MPRLAETIRHTLGTGALPARDPGQVRLGYGRGQLCSACGRSMPASEPEYEFEADDGGTVRFHLECYRLWEAESRRRGWRRRGSN